MTATVTQPVSPAPAAFAREHLILDGVSWSTYIALSDEVAAAGRKVRMIYDGGKLEIMTTSFMHERWQRILASMVQILSLELRLDITSLGATTWLSKSRAKGFEPDEAFMLGQRPDLDIDNEELARRYHADLTVEVDVTSSSLPREPIYAAFGVREIWRYDGVRLSIRLLGDDHRYHDTDRSVFGPLITAEAINTYLSRTAHDSDLDILLSFREWVRQRAAEG